MASVYGQAAGQAFAPPGSDGVGVVRVPLGPGGLPCPLRAPRAWTMYSGGKPRSGAAAIARPMTTGDHPRNRHGIALPLPLPVFGSHPLRTIRLTAVLEWLTRRLDEGTPKSSLKLYFELLDAVFNAAVTDKIIPDNPGEGVKLAQVLRGLSRAPKWVPTEDEVLALIDAVPARYRAAIWLGAGHGCRLGEALGMENGTRCVDSDRGDLHIIQQRRYAPQDHGGFYLSEPKAGSSGTVDLDPVVAQVLAEHTRDFPPVSVNLVDLTTGEPVRRSVPLLFTTTHGNPFTDRTWSREWAGWRDTAGWPKEHGSFHALRHFFATTLITNHAEPQEVQRLLRHKTLRITLETYVHWWPKRERPRGVIGTVLRSASARSSRTTTNQDQA